MKKLTPLFAPQDILESHNRFCDPDCPIEIWQKLAQNQYAQNSLLAMRNDWRHFVNFCIDQQLTALPATGTTVLQCLDIMRQDKKWPSLKRLAITITIVHLYHQYKDPCNEKQVQYYLRELRLNHQQQPIQADAFYESHLDELQSKLGHSDLLKDIRDVAIWSLCFEAVLKRNELSQLQYEQLHRAQDDTIFITFPELQIQLSPSGSDYLNRWLSVSLITQGVLFRRIDRHGNLGDRPLDHASIYRIFRRASDLIAENTLFSGQSARIGATQSLSKVGQPLKEIQRIGRWKSLAMPAQYTNNINLKAQSLRKFVKKKKWD